MVLAGHDVQSVVESNTYSGLEAQVKLNTSILFQHLQVRLGALAVMPRVSPVLMEILEVLRLKVKMPMEIS